MNEGKQAKQDIRAGKATFGIEKTMETFNDWYDAIMDAADITDRRYPVKGCPVMRPLGFFMHNAIMRELEKKYDEYGVQQVLFPTLIPRQFLAREEKHIEGFKAECFWVDGAGQSNVEEPMALRPTSETAMYSMFSLWVRSFRDLPLKLHQTCTIFRYETKNTKPLIRIREIPWNEAHTAHATKEEALQMMQDYWTISDYLFNEQLCFFGQKLVRVPWDQFPGAEHSEVLDVVMPCGKVLQTAGIHYLGQKFAQGDEPGTSGFNITFLDENNIKRYVEQTCCGISTRALACVIGIHGDDKGLVLPPVAAQFQIVLIPVGGKREQEVHEPIKKLDAKLKAAGYRTTIDFSKKSMGEKIFYWEVRGIPIRIELGPNDLENSKCVLTTRDIGKDGKQDIPLDELVAKLPSILKDYQDRLRDKAKKFHEDHVKICRTIQEVDDVIKNNGGLAKIPLKKINMNSQNLEQEIKNQIGVGEIRGYLPDEICEGEKCIVTGEPATVWGYYAKSY